MALTKYNGIQRSVKGIWLYFQNSGLKVCLSVSDGTIPNYSVLYHETEMCPMTYRATAQNRSFVVSNSQQNEGVMPQNCKRLKKKNIYIYFYFQSYFHFGGQLQLLELLLPNYKNLTICFRLLNFYANTSNYSPFQINLS